MGMAKNSRRGKVLFTWRRRIHRVGAVKKGFNNWLSVLMTVALRKLKASPGDLNIVTAQGSYVSCPNRIGAMAPVFEIFVYDSYHLREFSQQTIPNHPLTILDVGAHVGAFSLAMLEKFPTCRCICCEPSPKTFQYLRKNIERNGVQERVQLIEAAVLAEDRETALFEGKDGSAKNSVLIPLDGGKTCTVQGLAFDRLVDKLDSEVDVLKLDCEGAEYEILFNASPSTLEKIRSIVLEYHPVPGNGWNKIQEYLTAGGFQMEWHEPSLLDRGGMAAFRRVEKVEANKKIS